MKIIAEISSNHRGELQNAIQLIHEAKELGCWAVKIQLYNPSELATGSLVPIYEKNKTPFSWVPQLIQFARNLGIKIFPTVYTLRDLMFCEKFCNFDMYKISSFENEDGDLIKAVLNTNKYLFISTDLCNIKEVGNYLNSKGNFTGCCFKCTSQYPAEYKNMNLKTIQDLRGRFPSASIGLSDHTTDSVAGVVGCGLGIEYIEKHFMGNIQDAPESAFALNYNDMKKFIKDIADAELCLGSVNYQSGDTSRYKKRLTQSGYFRSLETDN